MCIYLYVLVDKYVTTNLHKFLEIISIENSQIIEQYNIHFEKKLLYIFLTKFL